MLTIRPFEEKHWPATWPMLEAVFRAGETYPFSPDITKQQAHYAWVELPSATYVAVDENDDVLGTYYIKPNQPTLGAHVCNCGYVVAEHARRRGVASQMCQHSQRQAVAQGYKSMQYNLVVSTNQRAVRLWKKHGFQVIGTLPKAFNHAQLGFVDALVMYKQLEA